MRNSLGISTGAAGCAAHSSPPTTPAYRTSNTARSPPTSEHRRSGRSGTVCNRADDHAGSRPPHRAGRHRGRLPHQSQAAAVRSAAKSQKRAIRLVPETAATLTYLRSTGLVAQYGIIALVDLGASVSP